MTEFNKCVAHYNCNRKVKTFKCSEQFLAVLFAQLTYRECLRDIKVCLNTQPGKLYHLGFQCKETDNSTIARANEHRDCRIVTIINTIYFLSGYKII
ncbi:MAG: hypothetical protein COX07_00155 [Bacteroidetes bacterium CG23_combo_of_CG06-09_8_20_14_all_32_9]|nr:MAG: hypothetical protein COX07_00155 [Bacteroidetes bacterium CG23_combo_of_CG06-09_8_20_14_all_32_9]